MQPRFISSLCSGIVFAGVIAACGISPAESGGPAKPVSQTYVFTPGQTINLSPNTTLKLDKVNDSRCRPGAVCVWKGYISFTFVLNHGGQSSQFVLAEDMPNGSNTATQQGLKFTLGPLDPAEPTPLHTAAPAYKVSLRVDIS
ncbi:hypothetical protein GCM10027277_40310 [Pseudoduganella ginsengisoli]|uniref:DUF2141 domain-containing protein n=1 Tax=Pseudoduganella ginsengisoli TaxID=1462440 RepID=A0A6L6PY88_9BURK|nr:hypothetical protein [Pseudoduganella ginsengisoli]MTW01898.1 hypothetical protein [Pseudoduganella ginsengisoli]